MAKKSKMPKAPKLPRPKTKELKVILKGLLTVSLANRIASLSYALQWYDKALPYATQSKKKYIPVSTDPKNPTKEQQALNIAVKARKHGIGATIDEEKETAFLTSVRNYEKAFHKMKVPHVDKYMDLFKAKKDKLADKQSKMVLKFGNVLQMMQKVIGPTPKLVVADAQKPLQYDPSLTTLTYNRESMKALSTMYRRQGLLAVFVDQLEVLSRSAALVEDPQKKGTWMLYPEKQVEAMSRMLGQFITYAQSPDSPKRLVRKVYPEAPVDPNAPVQPKARRAFAGGHAGPKVGGAYIPGSARATIYERLADGKEWDLNQLLAGVAHSNPLRSLKKIRRDGPAHGWKVNITGNKVKMEKATP